MTIVKLRDLGGSGIVTDVDPFDLPVNAYSFGKNIRFENGHIERGSVFRSMGGTTTDPKFIYTYQDQSNAQRILYTDALGRLYDWSPTTQADHSPSGFTPQDSDAFTSFININNLIVANRGDRVPWYRSKSSQDSFSPLPNWNTTDRAKVMTSIAGVLVALNITRGAQVLPTTVKWSDFVKFDTPPAWETLETNSAGENTLAQMQNPILDGVALRSRLMLYTSTETWFMDYIGGNDMFRWDRQFDKGVINTGCVIETNGIHYVFGSNDLWMHDGVSSKSIAQGSVRSFVFETMNKAASNQFFVAHNPDQNEILFCYVSDDADVRFRRTEGPGCNRAAVYNYAGNVWYFVDLPYVTCWTQAAIVAGKAFDQAPSSYDTFGGSYAAQEGETKLSFIMGSNANSTKGITRGLRSFTGAKSTTTALTLDPAANSPAVLRRKGMDLDELNADLRGYKLASSVYPQIRLNTSGQFLTFTLGSSDHPNEETVWGNSQTYDSRYYKLDHNMAGRFLSYEMVQDGSDYFTMSGLDVDLTLLGSR